MIGVFALRPVRGGFARMGSPPRVSLAFGDFTRGYNLRLFLGRGEHAGAFGLGMAPAVYPFRHSSQRPVVRGGESMPAPSAWAWHPSVFGLGMAPVVYPFRHSSHRPVVRGGESMPAPSAWGWHPAKNGAPDMPAPSAWAWHPSSSRSGTALIDQWHAAGRAPVVVPPVENRFRTGSDSVAGRGLWFRSGVADSRGRRLQVEWRGLRLIPGRDALRCMRRR